MIIATTGATAHWPGAPRERYYISHGISTCATCDGAFYRDLKVAVLGGGGSALRERNPRELRAWRAAPAHGDPVAGKTDKKSQVEQELAEAERNMMQTFA
ncbi:MAG: hypothetical protein M0Z66_02930 [Thermaerobacter sp.]|nr:hypothetical protein [Thermaerobacter sp.]